MVIAVWSKYDNLEFTQQEVSKEGGNENLCDTNQEKNFGGVGQITRISGIQQKQEDMFKCFGKMTKIFCSFDVMMKLFKAIMIQKNCPKS